MKAKMKFLVVYISFIIASLIYAKEASAQSVAVSFQFFYDELSPYGHWVDYPGHGYVWLPDVEPGFTPYSTNGYWVMTEYGMTWVSDYTWGWAPFHYGRWEYDNSYGWFWVPDTEWGPAWVVWRQSSGYYGWAPMRPGISITVSFGSHYHHAHNHWVFVRYRDIDRHDLHRCRINRRYHHQIIRNSTVINNIYVDNSHTTYVAGPDRKDLQRNLGRSVRTVSIHEDNRPGQSVRNDRLNIYRPRVSRTDDRQERVAPNRLAKLNDIKRNPDQNSLNQRQTVVQSNNTKQNQRQDQNQYTNNRQKQENTYRSDNTRRNLQNTNQSNNRQQQVNRNQQNQNTHNNVNSSRNNSRDRQQTTINRSNNNKTENQRKSTSENNNKRRR